MHAFSTVDTKEVGTYHFTRAPKNDMDTHMVTLLEVRLGTWVENWVEQKKLNPKLDTNPKNCFLQKFNFQEYKPSSNGFLGLKNSEVHCTKHVQVYVSAQKGY